MATAVGGASPQPLDAAQRGGCAYRGKLTWIHKEEKEQGKEHCAKEGVAQMRSRPHQREKDRLAPAGHTASGSSHRPDPALEGRPRSSGLTAEATKDALSPHHPPPFSSSGWAYTTTRKPPRERVAGASAGRPRPVFFLREISTAGRALILLFFSGLLDRGARWICIIPTRCIEHMSPLLLLLEQLLQARGQGATTSSSSSSSCRSLLWVQLAGRALLAAPLKSAAATDQACVKLEEVANVPGRRFGALPAQLRAGYC